MHVVFNIVLLLYPRIIAHIWAPPFCFSRGNAVFMLLLCSCIIAHTVGAAILFREHRSQRSPFVIC